MTGYPATAVHVQESLGANRAAALDVNAACSGFIYGANLDRYGNTSAATIPIAYDEVVREGRVVPGDLVVFTGFGGGFTWGAMVFRNVLG